MSLRKIGIRYSSRPAGTQVVVTAAEETEVLVETPAVRVKLWGGAEVPLPDGACPVTGRFEHLGQGRLVEREAEPVVSRDRRAGCSRDRSAAGNARS